MDDINSNSIEQLSDTDIEMLYNDVLESSEIMMSAKCCYPYVYNKNFGACCKWGSYNGYTCEGQKYDTC